VLNKVCISIFQESSSMPRVYLVSSTDSKNITYREELALSLQREGITIESVLANCQVMVLFQTVETAQLPHVRQLFRSATRLVQQQRLDEIVRFVCEEIEPLPEGWETITAVDATENRAAAAKQLAQFILHTSGSSMDLAERAMHTYPQAASEVEPPSFTSPQRFMALDNPFEEPTDPRKASTDPRISAVTHKTEMPRSSFEKDQESATPSSEHNGRETLDNSFENQENTLLPNSAGGKSALEELGNLFPTGSRPTSGELTNPSLTGPKSVSRELPDPSPTSARSTTGELANPSLTSPGSTSDELANPFSASARSASQELANPFEGNEGGTDFRRAWIAALVACGSSVYCPARRISCSVTIACA
jgi:hypothetical protein